MQGRMGDGPSSGFGCAGTPCQQAVRALFAGPLSARLTAFADFSVRVLLRHDGIGPPIDGKPSLGILCRRSDESCVADELHQPKEEFAGILAAGGRGFFLQPAANVGVIHLVEDRLSLPSTAAAQSVLEELLAHEGTHAADAMVHGADLSMCGALACSEVRAASFGECAESAFAWTRQRCVRNVARKSVDMAFPGAGHAAVDTVFDWCYGTPLGHNFSQTPPFREAMRQAARAEGSGTSQNAALQ